MTLTILSLLCMGLAIVFAQETCNDNPFVVGCYDDPYMAKVTCAGDQCECDPAGEEICTNILAVAITAADLNGEKCKDICEETTGCVYYRWDKEGSINSQCLLMDINQCNGFIPCDRKTCLSGQAKCDGGLTPVPDGVQCHGGVEFNTEAVHWQCFYLADIEKHINIYIDGEVPTGVICTTAQKCDKFDTGNPDATTDPYYRDLVVQCNPDRVTNVDIADWGKFEGSDNDVTEFIDATTKHLKDPKCEAEWPSLELDAPQLHEPGVLFICENTDTEHFITTEATVTIKAPNTCALLCNFHPTLTIENELASDGTGVWNKYDAGSNDGTQVIENQIKCWDFMKI